ncbi:MAG TPA: hypothetical protein VFH51_08470, partial [Myxococcota bacterium]|nr:hypothetical protein [Myxococcota bacterium]
AGRRNTALVELARYSSLHPKFADAAAVDQVVRHLLALGADPRAGKGAMQAAAHANRGRGRRGPVFAALARRGVRPDCPCCVPHAAGAFLEGLATSRPVADLRRKLERYRMDPNAGPPGRTPLEVAASLDAPALVRALAAIGAYRGRDRALATARAAGPEAAETLRALKEVPSSRLTALFARRS